MQLAQRIRNIRERKNLTQAEVADLIGISPSAYGQIERKASKSTFETLSKITNALGVSIPFLVDIDYAEYTEKSKL